MKDNQFISRSPQQANHPDCMPACLKGGDGGPGGPGTLQRIDVIWHFSRIKKLVKPVTFAKKRGH